MMGTPGWSLPPLRVVGEPMQEEESEELPIYLCWICDQEGTEHTVPKVEPGVIALRGRKPSEKWESHPTCADRIACRHRCEAMRVSWPIDDGTPATRFEDEAPPPADVAPVATPEPTTTPVDDTVEELDFG